MIENYYKNKLNYRDYLILMKYGNFYELIGDDAFIANMIFNYKLTKLSNNYKVGFPLSNIDRVKSELNNLNINYIIIDKENINCIKKFDVNNYNKYDSKLNIYKKNVSNVNKIINYLNENVNNEDLYNKLIRIMEIIDE